MSQRARDYVERIAPHQITSTERFLLTIIAEEYSDRFGSANFELELLCDATGISRRHVRRVLAGLSELLDYLPGRGEGHFSQFRFPGIGPVESPVEKPVLVMQEGDKKGTRRGQEGDAQGHAIRKDLNLDQDQDQNPPNPPSSKGGTFYSNPLTVRRTKELNFMLDDLMAPTKTATGWNGPAACATLGEAVERACARLLIPVEQAWAVLEASGLGDARKRDRFGRKKAPQSA